MGTSRDDLIRSLKGAAAQTGAGRLTYNRFRELTGIPMSAILRQFDSWRDACAAAGITSGDNGPGNLTPNYSRGKLHAVSQLQQVADRLGTRQLSKSMFDSQSPEVRASTVAKMFGGWDNAKAAAGLERHSLHHDVLPLDVLADDLLRAYREVGGIPTVHQLSRRSSHSLNSFTRKFGGYTEFKRQALALLLHAAENLSASERDELTLHLESLGLPEPHAPQPALAHHRGRHLGFRAFAFSPTYENEVVSIFSVVAQELGFEIVCQRPAFPDCEARRLVDSRRRRYQRCLIEFELNSSDYVRHKHPLQGCDLVVCWNHDWAECPIEVLELRAVIRRLPGWT